MLWLLGGMESAGEEFEKEHAGFLGIAFVCHSSQRGDQLVFRYPEVSCDPPPPDNNVLRMLLGAGCAFHSDARHPEGLHNTFCSFGLTEASDRRTLKNICRKKSDAA